MDWPRFLLAPVVAVYLILMSLLLTYVLNYLYLAVIGLRSSEHRFPVPTTLPDWPAVTVQLPIYNEMYVAARLVSAAAALEYPAGKLEIQVLDDSTDETAALIAAEVARLSEGGVDIVHLRRDARRGFKAGALADGLNLAKGEFVAIFDADFVPPTDFLRQTMPRFDHANVAFVQARWGHLNRDYSALTVLQSLSLDAHFAIDQQARSAAGHFFNFNGTAGIWRKAAILDAGGWRADTLTEDLDLSYRALLRGWHARYAADVHADGELPVSFTAFRRQQLRWARGSMECAIQFLPRIWRLDAPLLRKMVASLHLTGYLSHFLTLGLILLFPVLLELWKYYPALLNPVGFGLAANLMFLVPTVYFAVGQQLLRRRWLRQLPMIAGMTVLASGLMVNTLHAAIQILFRRGISFERTPKYGILQRHQDWRGSKYRVKTEPIVFVEVLLAAFTIWTASLAFQMHHWLIMFYSLCFAAGLLFTSGMTLVQTLSERLVSGKMRGSSGAAP